MNYYKLENKKAVPCTMLEWSMMFSTTNRTIAYDKIGDCAISTIFLGIDHSFTGRPLIFETMVFSEEEFCKRYETYDQAESGHKKIVSLIKEGINPDDLYDLNLEDAILNKTLKINYK